MAVFSNAGLVKTKDDTAFFIPKRPDNWRVHAHDWQFLNAQISLRNCDQSDQYLVYLHFLATSVTNIRNAQRSAEAIARRWTRAKTA